MDEQLGDDPSLLLGLTLFLVVGTAEEWDDTPSPSNPKPVDFPWPPPVRAPALSHLCRRGWPRVPAKPSAGQSQSWTWSRGVNPVNHPHRWIHAEMEMTVHHHQWKEIKASGRVSMGSHIVWESLCDTKELHYAQWQVAAFRLALAQNEALGWWDAPSWLSRLCSQDFMPHTKTSGTKDFWSMRQEKTLALACALHTCAERSGMPTRVPCNSTRELQRCMAPLMCLSEDEIVEASLLGPAGNEHRTSPTPEEEATLMGEEPELPETPKATSPLTMPRDPWTHRALRADWSSACRVHWGDWCS